MNGNDNSNEFTAADEVRLGQSPESGLRIEPSVVGIGESGSGGIGFGGGKDSDNTSESSNRIVAASIREAELDKLTDPFAELRLLSPLTDANAEEAVTFVRHVIDVSQDIIRSSEEKIRSQLSDYVSSIIQSVDYCDGCIRGCFGRICDRADEIVTKCERKIRNRVDESIANSYYFTFQFFGPPPTTEEVLAELGLQSYQSTSDSSNITLESSASGKPNCPPGYEPIWNGQEQRWLCVPVCPPGHVRDMQSGACVPFEKPSPIEPPTKEPPCPVEYPPPPGTGGTPIPKPTPPEPPCPMPSDLVCPPGQIAAFVNGVWKCVPIDKAPGAGVGDIPEKTFCPTERQQEPCIAAGIGDVLGVVVPDWNSPNTCDVLATLRNFSPATGKKLADIIPWKYDATDGRWIVPEDVHEFIQGLDSLTRRLILGVGGSLIAAADAIIPIISKLGGCDWTFALPLQIIDSLFDLLEKYTGIRSNALSSSIQYAINYWCPSQLPSQVEINQIYYSGLISHDVWRCLTRAIGNYDHWAKLIRDVNAPQLTPDELSVAYFRNIISKEELIKELTQRYGLPVHIAQNYTRLKVALPGIGDIVRFMVRDVADPKIVEKYGYDSEFQDKFQGKLKDWASNLGVEEEVFRYYWRAHWELPSPTQLYEMLRRLRKDSLDPEARALAVTKEEVAAALAANDVPKYWRDRLMAVSYLPMTPSDAKQAYIEGAIDEPTYRSIIKDSGRNEQHTQWIFELADRQKKRRIMNLVGGFSPTKITSWFKAGAIDDAMARRLYVDAGLTDELAERAIRIAKTSLRSERIEKRIQLVRKRYLVGDLSPDEARALLLKIGAELNRVNEMIEDWELEIQIRSKQVAAQTLCDWYYRKLITEEEYAIRLRRIGYQPMDVERIIASCAIQSAEKTFDRKVKTVRGLKVLKEANEPKKNGKPSQPKGSKP